jgi:two-component system LytT family sensor kinase
MVPGIRHGHRRRAGTAAPGRGYGRAMRRDVWKDWRTWAVVAGIFTAFGLLNAVQFRVGAYPGAPPVGWGEALGGTLPFWYAKALLLPGVLWLGRRFPLGPGRWGPRLLPHVPASLLYSAGHITAGAAGAWLLAGESLADPDFIGRVQGLFTAYGVVGIVYYWAFLGTILAFDYHRRFRERERAAAELELRASRLESSLARASLETLRMQLNPHFLFNTLNSISVLAQTGRTDGVIRMLSRLSDVLRTTLERTDPEIPLDAELEFVDTYLEIEQVRFGDRLTVERVIEPAARSAIVPGLLLQPLVENALKHGLGGARGPVSIRIEASVADAAAGDAQASAGPRLRLRVADSGRGFPAGVTDRLGVGLANTRARLEQIYGDDHGIELSPPGAGATVTITIPYRPAGPDDRQAAARARDDERPGRASPAAAASHEGVPA